MLDNTITAWTSGDAAKIKALYSPDIVGYDPISPGLVSDHGEWDKLQDGFAAAKYDKASVSGRDIQVLDGNTFVTTISATLYQSGDTSKNIAVRCTDVFERAAGGKWPIVNEHCSAMPKT